MIELLRAVLDTNVYVSAVLSKSPTSPNRELLTRWKNGEFTVITCSELVMELIDKLNERNIAAEAIEELAAALIRLAEWIEAPAEAAPPVLSDPDDDIVLACAVLGHATHLVTYDPHFDPLGGEYRRVKIVKALPFLWAVRGDTPPENSESSAAR